MADRYCRNCGHELAEDDRFCPNCGRPVHEAAHVPTPEADVPVPPPPQRAAEETSQPTGTWKWFPLVAFLVLATLFVIAGLGSQGDGGGENSGGERGDSP